MPLTVCPGTNRPVICLSECLLHFPSVFIPVLLWVFTTGESYYCKSEAPWGLISLPHVGGCSGGRVDCRGRQARLVRGPKCLQSHCPQQCCQQVEWRSGVARRGPCVLTAGSPMQASEWCAQNLPTPGPGEWWWAFWSWLTGPNLNLRSSPGCLTISFWHFQVQSGGVQATWQEKGPSGHPLSVTHLFFCPAQMNCWPAAFIWRVWDWGS